MNAAGLPAVNYADALTGHAPGRGELVNTFEIRTEDGNELTDAAPNWTIAVTRAIRHAYDRREPMLAVDAVTGHLLRVEHLHPTD